MNIKFEIYNLKNDIITTSITPLCKSLDPGESFEYQGTNDGTYYIFFATNGSDNADSGVVMGWKAYVASAKIYDIDGKATSIQNGSWYHLDSDGNLHECENNAHHKSQFPS